MRSVHWLSMLLLGLITLQSPHAMTIDSLQNGHSIRSGDISVVNEQNGSKPGSWSINIDNDLFFPAGTDRDYTGGLNFSRQGNDLSGGLSALRRPLAAIDQILLGQEGIGSNASVGTAEFGLYGFTPEAIESADIVKNDRPYASLIYYSNSATRIDWTRDATWESSLTIGALGLGVFEGLQNQIHGISNTARADGWSNQISDGGELTARYQLARQRLLASNQPGLELKSSQHVSLGYLTEVGYSLSFRLGEFSSAWWAFKPNLTSYAEQSGNLGRLSKYAQDQFIWGGISIKARAHNAFLQGQFRDSQHQLDFDQLEHLLAEAWLGYTQSLGAGYALSYQVRVQSSEIKHGEADRSLLWGGLRLSKSL